MESMKTRLRDAENSVVVAEGVGETGEGGQRCELPATG